MTTNVSTEENKTIYQSTSKEKESSTENFPLATAQGKSIPELDTNYICHGPFNRAGLGSRDPDSF